MACTEIVCGTGNSNAPKPGDPDNTSVVSAAGVSGGNNISWTYPVINPHAVAFVDVYRAKYDRFSLATRLIRVAGDFYFDRIGPEDIREYFYWIKITSVNGTEGEPIGPASATPSPSAQEILDQLSGVLDMSYLSDAVKVQLNKVSILEGSVGEEIQKRITQDNLMGEALSAVQAETGQAVAFIEEEIVQRTSAHEALLDVVNSMAVGMEGNSAAIAEEQLVRADAISALALSVSQMATTVDENTVAVEEATTLVNGVAGQYTLKIDNNGHISGFGLASTAVNAVPYSEFTITANAFKFGAPDGTKTPFSIVDTGGGAYKTLLNSDVLIGGNVDIANLNSGSLASDVKLSLGGGIIDLDGAGEIRVYKDLEPNADYVRLSSGEIRFLRYINGSYETYNYLSRIETGEAANNTEVFIPGYWKSQPRVMVSPASIQMYNAGYAAQNQAINCQATSIVETEPGSLQWKFTQVANLSLASGTVNGVVNEADTTADSTWYSDTHVTNANTTSIDISVDVKSSRGTGTVNTYAYRQVTVTLQYWEDATWKNGAYKTLAVGAALNAVTGSLSFNFPTSATWQYRLRYAAADAGGTFTTGATQYDYDTDLHVVNADPARVDLSIFPGAGSTPTKSQNISVGGYAPPAGWSISSVRYQYDIAFYQYVAKVSGTARSTISGKNFSQILSAAANNTPYQAGNSALTNWQTVEYIVNTDVFDPLVCSLLCEVSSAANNRSDTSVDLRNVSVWITRKRPQPTVAVTSNYSRFNSFIYSLSTAEILATGSLNWMAIGE